jgi:hypothetical protein
MTEAKWMEFVHLYWAALGYWEMMKAFTSKEFQGAFFELSKLACRNSLLLGIAKFVELCKKTDHDLELGAEATKALDALKAHTALKEFDDRGRKKDRNDLDYQSCGVGTFRNMELSHPLNAIKRVLDKDTYKISLEWKTVQETLDLMKLFQSQVEEYHRGRGTWQLSTITDTMFDVESGAQDTINSLEHARKYAKLCRTIMTSGEAKVRFSFVTKELEIVS